MKRTISICLMIAGIALLLTNCADRKAEKRIAELESQMAQLQSKGGAASPAVTTPVDAAPTVADEKPEGPLPIAQFEKVDHDFGTVNEGLKVSYTYKLKNTGEAPLIIQNAQPSCGCTVPTWTKEPIPVGGTGLVKAEFDTNGKTGINNKTITVTANTWPKTTTLRFKAMVTAKADQKGPTR
ncbi:DUF1573 domain-containing protein [soil metagenome]